MLDRRGPAAAAVLEFVFTATRAGKSIGVVAAAVVRFDHVGEVVIARLYIDVPTIVGQIVECSPGPRSER